MGSTSRRIKLSATTEIDSERFSQKIVNHNTGKTKISNRPEPRKWTHSGTIISEPSEPVKLEDKTEQKGDKAKEVKSPANDPYTNPATVGYDTSQL